MITVKTKIYTFIAKRRGGFMGWIKVYEGDKYLYSLKTKIHRLTKLDAKNDAEILKQEILEPVFWDKPIKDDCNLYTPKGLCRAWIANFRRYDVKISDQLQNLAY